MCLSCGGAAVEVHGPTVAFESTYYPGTLAGLDCPGA